MGSARAHVLRPRPPLSRPSAVEPVELVEAILYKLKGGCRWRLLPVKPFFTGASLTWQGVYARVTWSWLSVPSSSRDKPVAVVDR